LRNKVFIAAIFLGFVAFALSQTCERAEAIPIFAQRYHLQCGACHSVLPELNAFGQSFRAHGYRLSAPAHGTTVVAVRYQLEYEVTPASGNKRFEQGGIILGNYNFGAVSAFVHYTLGADGGPGGLFLGYLATYNPHTRSLYRAGLFELPLAQSPGQRLDDLQQYGYYGTHVGLNDLSLASPRWGAQLERTVGSIVGDFTVSTGEFKGSAYGGKPVSTGETTWNNVPEVGLFLRGQIIPGLEAGGSYMNGQRWIVPNGRPGFADTYNREGLLLHGTLRRWDLQAEQWWGTDLNADGFGTVQGSSGGYARLKYYPAPHLYLAARYDAGANPFLSRDMVYYAAWQFTPHTRLIVQQVQTIPGPGHFGAAITVAAPWPPNL
jgi:hypothetical protein